MSPYLEEQISENSELEPPNEHIHLTLTPLTDLSARTSVSEENPSIDSESGEESPHEDLINVNVTEVISYLLPLEHNIRNFLTRVSGTERLETVTQIKLRVIARELALQQLGTFLPALRELILDGSIVSSLRDLGYGLRNLKILRVNRCQLTCIDGVLGFEQLEELYAADNAIKDLSPCAFLSNLKIVDVRRNCIKHVGSLDFLSFCPDIHHVLISGNEVTENFLGYRGLVKRMLPQLQMLDGEPLSNDSLNGAISIEDLDDQDDSNNTVYEGNLYNAARNPSRAQVRPNGFTVRFPPRVCGNNHFPG